LNKYQNKINKKIKEVIKQELNELDNKYPIIKNNMRSIYHTLEYFEITGRKHYRHIKRKLGDKSK
jgi:hypothetical protein